MDEQQPFNLLDRFLNKMSFYSIENYKSMTEDDLVKKLKEKIISYLDRN